MADKSRLSPEQLGKLYALGQVGTEMVAPIILGLLLDYYLGWLPWLTLTGVILGFSLGMVHILRAGVNKPGPPQDRS